MSNSLQNNSVSGPSSRLEKDLAYAFTLLLKEELIKSLPDNVSGEWEILDLGQMVDVTAAAGAALLLTTQSLKCFVPSKRYTFRVDVFYFSDILVVRAPWEEKFVGRPHISCSLYYNLHQDGKLDWPVGEPPPYEFETKGKQITTRIVPGIHHVCRNMRGLIDDPHCQELMAGKICVAIVSWLLGVPQLPDH
jgi:hypothetical protein